MNIERKDIDEVNVVLTMQVEKSDYQANVEKVLRDYAKKANIPGFRAGKVPVSYIKKMYGKSAEAEELNKFVGQSLYKYIADNKLNVLGEPLPSETEKSDIDLDSDKPATFVFDVALAPDFKVELNGRNSLTQYNITIDDKMMEDAVKQYTGRFGSYEQAEESVEDDLLKGEVVELENGKVKEGGIKNDAAILGPKYIKDADQRAMFIGVKKGGVVVFNVKKIMDSDAEIAAFLKINKDQVAGLTNDFQLTVNEITRYKAAELNQDLFDKALGKDVVKSEDEFKAKIKENLQSSLAVDSDYKLLADARATVIKKMADAKFPEAFLKRWVKLTNKDKNITDEEIEKEFPAMLDGLKWQLAKGQLAEKHNIKVEEKDMLEFGKKMARAQFAQYGMMSAPDDVVENYAKSLIKDEKASRNMVEQVMDEKILAVVKESVKLNPKEVSLEEFNKLVSEAE